MLTTQDSSFLAGGLAIILIDIVLSILVWMAVVRFGLFDKHEQAETDDYDDERDQRMHALLDEVLQQEADATKISTLKRSP